MKKQILICLLLVAGAVFNLHAQSTTSLGLRGGINFANIAPANDSNENRLAPNFGAFITRSLEEHWGLTAEVNYSGRGSKASSTFGNFVFKSAYLEVPLYTTYYFLGRESAFRPKIFLGAAPALLMTAKVNDTDVKEDYHAFELSAVGGLGFNYRMTDGGNWLHFDVRYNYGLTELADQSNAIIKVDPVYNRTLSVNLGVTFPLGE